MPTINGTPGDDIIPGTGVEDIIDGGAGADLIMPGAGPDTMTGGPGYDVFEDTAANLNGDNITDFDSHDRIIITDATLSSFVGLSYNQIHYQVGSVDGILTLSLSSGEILRRVPLIIRTAAGGGIELTMAPNATNDFNGDYRSDIILRDSQSGWLTDWLGTANGALTNNGSNASILFTTDWKVVGTGDFNGDGNGDFLLRDDSGWLTNWLGTDSGGFNNNGANASLFFTPDWKVVGIGDFNGDGSRDTLLRSDAGWVTDWLGTINGGFTNNGSNASLFFTSDWNVVGTGDFNGDGIADMLLRRNDGWLTDWLGNLDGSFTNNGANTALFFTTDWKVIGTGDFNGDGLSDFLLRRTDGWLTDWLGTSNGGFTNNGANTALFFTPDWHISSIVDFNGDGRDDLLLRNDSGWMTDWLATATSFANNGSGFSTFAAPNWQVQDPFVAFL